MAALSDYAENKLLDHLLGKAAYTMPTTVYLALYTVAPSDSGGGTEVSTSGTAYAREAITSLMSAASGGASSNSSAIEFDVATASWGTVVAVGIFDAATAGNLLMHGSLSVSQTINTGNQFVLPIGDLDAALT